MGRLQADNSVFVFLICLLLLNAVFSVSAWNLKARWMNVPPVPSERSAIMSGLGDAEFSYRPIGLMLQNLGNSGGRTVPFIQYDYDALVEWLFLAKKLSPRSDFVSYMAAFYFSSVQDGEKAAKLIPFLAEAGRGSRRNSWRWMAQAVFIARFQAKDLDLAYRLATELAELPDPRLPVWARQMPAFILNEQGQKQAAYALLVSMMRSEVDSLPPEELNAMRDYVCRDILTQAEAKSDPICVP